MAKTDFTALTTEQKAVWSRKLWREAMSQTFIKGFIGKDHNSMIQHITELTKTEKGDLAVMTLIAELTGDGVVGDGLLEGNEEAINAYDKTITIDQLRNANRTTGRMSDQKSIVNFRGISKSVLATWLSDRIDQLAFLTMSGMSYSLTNTGAARGTTAFANLSFAADVTAPTANRHVRWSNTDNDLAAGDTTAITAADKLTYAALVRARAYAKENYMRGIRNSKLPTGDIFHVFITPSGMADLKLDPMYRDNLLYAAPRSKGNDVFSGSVSVMADGLVIHEFHHVFNTKGAAGGSKWGGSGGIDGQRVLICGAQALGLADLGLPYWEEEDFDYKNQIGISIGKMMGLIKPKFMNSHFGSEEDFGILTLDTAL